MSEPRVVLGPGAVVARTIKGSVTTTFTPVGGVRDRLVDAIFDPSPLYESLGLARFTGRAELIAKIDGYIATHRSGYVLVRGEAGVGKSTLAAYLVLTRGYVQHFTRVEGARSPEQARRSIASQLIGAWDLADELGAGEDFPAVADRPDWLVKVLWCAARRRDQLHPGFPLVLVVDGLDEADSPAPGRDTGIPLGLPRPESLPDGVFVVGTSRYGTPLAAAIRDQDSWHTISVDGAENLADMRRFLIEAVSGDHPLPVLVNALVRDGVDCAEFVDTLTERCAGVWIYLRYVLDDIVVGRCSVRDVAGLPDRLAGYYLEQIQRWSTATEWSAVGLRSLATLVALRRPASRAEVAGFAGVDNDDRLRGWLDQQFRSFLNVTRALSRQRRYTILHQSFRDLFAPPTQDDDRDDGIRDALHDAVTDAHRRISIELMRRIRAEFPLLPEDEYTRAELADHATAAGMLDELSTNPAFLLACDPPSLLRRRDAATTSQTNRALAAYELSLGHRDTETRLWWLHVWARKTRCHALANQAVAGLQRSWTVIAGIWSGTQHRSLMGHNDEVSALCVVPLPDGRMLLASAGNDMTVRLWDPAIGEAFGDPLTGHTGRVNALCAVPLPDGRMLLASAGWDATVRLWDPAIGEAFGDPLTGHTGRVNALCAVPLPDGRMLLASAGWDATVRLWDPAIGEACGEFLAGQAGGVAALCAVPVLDGRMLLASAGWDATVRLWDPAIGEAFGEFLAGHAGGVAALCAVPVLDGRMLLASAGDDMTVRLWDPAIGEAFGDPLTGHTGRVNALCAVPLPDGRMLLASASTITVQLWDPAIGEAFGDPLTGHTGGVAALCAVPLPDGRMLLASAGNDMTVRLWDHANTAEAPDDPFAWHADETSAMCPVPLPGGRMLVASADNYGTVWLLDPTTAEPVGDPLTGHTDIVNALCAVPLPDGRTLLASAGSTTMQLWDLTTRKAFADPFSDYTRGSLTVCAVPLPDGRMLLASAGWDATVRLWDPATGEAFGDPLAGHAGGVAALCAVPVLDGRMLLASAGDDMTVRLWDPATGEALGEFLTGHTDGVSALCAVPLPDGRMLLASAGNDDMTVRLWDPATGEAFGDPLTGHTDWVDVLCPVPLSDGRTLLASAGWDATVRLWDPATGEAFGPPLTGHTDWVNALCAVPRPDGRTILVTRSADRAVLIWESSAELNLRGL